MVDQPAQAPPGGGAAFEPDIDLSGLFLPWSDMQARDVPPTRLKIGTRMVPVLAVLAGQSKGVGRLIQLDQSGRLPVTATPTPQNPRLGASNGRVQATSVDIFAPAFAGRTYTLWQVRLEIRQPLPGGSLLLEQTDGQILDRYNAESAAAVNVDYGGLVLPQGVGIQWHNPEASGVGVGYRVWYSYQVQV